MGTFNTGSYQKPSFSRESVDDFEVFGFDGFDFIDDFNKEYELLGLPFEAYINFNVKSDIFYGYYEGLYINHILSIELELDCNDIFGMGCDSILDIDFDFKRENVDFYSLDYSGLIDSLHELGDFYGFRADHHDISKLIDFLYLKFVGRFNREIILPITNKTEYGGWCNGYGNIDKSGHYT